MRTASSSGDGDNARVSQPNFIVVFPMLVQADCRYAVVGSSVVVATTRAHRRARYSGRSCNPTHPRPDTTPAARPLAGGRAGGEERFVSCAPRFGGRVLRRMSRRPG